MLYRVLHTEDPDKWLPHIIVCLLQFMEYSLIPLCQVSHGLTEFRFDDESAVGCFKLSIVYSTSYGGDLGILVNSILRIRTSKFP